MNDQTIAAMAAWIGDSDEETRRKLRDAAGVTNRRGGMSAMGSGFAAAYAEELAASERVAARAARAHRDAVLFGESVTRIEWDEPVAAWRNNPARIFRLVIGEEMRRLLYWCALIDGLVAS